MQKYQQFSHDLHGKHGNAGVKEVLVTGPGERRSILIQDEQQTS